ncbi:MAG: TOBE domain-containing protein [Chlorobiaceae bacterium]|nr:TOBE domain-containing protein [Chlorobiaceae bacterium]
MSKTKDPIGIEGSIWFQKSQNRFLGGDRIELLEKIGELGSINSAAKAVGISYKTAWHLVNMMNNLSEKPLVDRMTGGKGGGGTVLTREGRQVIEKYRIVQEEHRKFLENLEERLGETGNLYQFLRRISMRISARNTFGGVITEIVRGGVNSEITITLNGGQPIVSVITNGAVDNLGLKEGMSAYAIIKSNAVIVGRDLHDTKLSTRNIMCGTVQRVIDGPVSSEVDVEIGGGNIISAIITKTSSEKLAFKEGEHACAIFKASDVIVGVN